MDCVQLAAAIISRGARHSELDWLSTALRDHWKTNPAIKAA